MVEPVSAASVADGEALYLESLLRSISLILFADSPSFLISMMRSCRGFAMHTPFSTYSNEEKRSLDTKISKIKEIIDHIWV